MQNLFLAQQRQVMDATFALYFQFFGKTPSRL
jgi:hypothetical protein